MQIQYLFDGWKKRSKVIRRIVWNADEPALGDEPAWAKWVMGRHRHLSATARRSASGSSNPGRRSVPERSRPASVSRHGRLFVRKRPPGVGLANLADRGDGRVKLVVMVIEVRREPDARAGPKIAENVARFQALRNLVAIGHVNRDSAGPAFGVARRRTAVSCLSARDSSRFVCRSDLARIASMPISLTISSPGRAA